MATAHIIAMEVDQGLNGLLHRCHLQKGHLAISGVKNKGVDGLINNTNLFRKVQKF